MNTIDGYGAVWQLTIDPTDTFNEDGLRNQESFVDTLVHELGHIVLLNDDQIHYYSPHTPLGSCRESEITLARGCVLENAFLHDFIERFWPIEEIRQVERDEKTGNQYDAATKRYRIHANQFVSPYAATSPIEDSAESFAAFVLNASPSGRSVAAEKIRYFEDFPELKELRKQVRANLRELGVLE